jgi:hypothetical protein
MSFMKYGIIGGLPSTQYSIPERATRDSTSGYFYSTKTTAAMAIYVDGTNGDDTNGDGSLQLPYKTWDRGYLDVRDNIAHACEIFLAEGEYDVDLFEINSVFTKQGFLSVVGIGEPIVVSGPYTVTGVADLGTGGQRITIGAGGLGATDSQCGNTIKILTGGHVDTGYNIVSNTSSTIDIVLKTNKMVNGDTFNIVRPAVILNTNKCAIVYRNHSNDAWDGDTFSQFGPRLILHNIWINMADSPQPVVPMKLVGISGMEGPYFEFVKITLPDSMYNGIMVEDCIVGDNGNSPYDLSWIDDGNTGFSNMGDPYGDRIGLGITGEAAKSYIFLNIRGSNIYISDVACKGSVASSPPVTGMYLTKSGFGAILMTQGFISTEKVIIAGYGTDVGIYLDNCNFQLTNTYIQSATDAIQILTASRGSIGNVACSSTGVTGSGMSIGPGCFVQQSGACTGLLGATTARAAYRFVAPSSDVLGTAWLSADGDSETDSMGAWIVRRS